MSVLEAMGRENRDLLPLLAAIDGHLYTGSLEKHPRAL